MTTDTEAAAPKTHGWRGQLLQLAAIVLAVFIAKGAFAEPFYVPSGSMEPTLLIGDALLASKYPYGYSAASLPIQITLPETGRVFGGMPKRGDVWCSAGLATGLKPGSSAWSGCRAIVSRCGRASSSSMTIRRR